jgi:hypothetical protein
MSRVAAQPGDTIEMRATGPTVRSEPDEEGCVHATTPTGRASFVLGEGAPEPVDLVLDTILESTVCTTTATPRPPRQATPPATDAGDAGRGGAAGTGWLGVLAVLAATTALVALAPRRRRAGARAGGPRR